MKIRLILGCFLTAATQRIFADGKTVTLPDGATLTGRDVTTENGNRASVFLGVPYAQPPVEELRWEVCSAVL